MDETCKNCKHIDEYSLKLQELKYKSLSAHVDLCPHMKEICIDFFACNITETQCMGIWCKQEYVIQFIQKLNEKPSTKHRADARTPKIRSRY